MSYSIPRVGRGREEEGAIGLDQIYTKPAVAERCVRFLSEALGGLRDLRPDRVFYVEPSAGEGCFLDLLPAGRRIGIDIEPRQAGIVRDDFLTWPFESAIEDPRQTVVVGNPPFGHRSRLAIRFFNRAAAMANTIAFVVPVQFRKYSVHKNLRPGFRWIAAMELDGPAFYTRAYPDYRLNAEFQVWTRETNHDFEDMRLLRPPAIRHADFEMWQYNNTPGALKVFDHDFDFAVPRQGYQDYSRRETSADRCERTKQWILFKARTPAALDRLLGMDFAALSQNNTITPGFGKADVVKEYLRISEQVSDAYPPAG
ncbi:MAG: hypothetical protein F4X74_12435 [Acidimicrobiia bacterium]|nr:hypothetical protein [Acidimicrobiia bacterium]